MPPKKPSKEIAISIQNLTKVFNVSDTKTNTIKHFLFNLAKNQKNLVSALSNISLDVYKGEKVGFIGRNGCGKSTLAKVIAGVYLPTSGSVKVTGSLMLMNLGLGINQELTVRENVYLVSSILGNRIKETDVFFDELIAFAELENFTNRKVKYLSSGMNSRLAFSIALYAHSDIFILDEIFAVGDAKFVKKATAMLEDKILNNSTVLLISHSDQTIQKYCHKAGYLRNGELVYYGDTKTALHMYQSDNNL